MTTHRNLHKNLASLNVRLTIIKASTLQEFRMPTVAASPSLSLQHTPRVNPTATVPQAAAKPESTSRLRSDLLAPVDTLILSTTVSAVEEGAIQLFGGYKDTRLAMQRQSESPQALIKGDDLLHSVKRSMVLRGLTSTARNGWKVMRGQQDVKEATGQVVADVSVTAVSGTVGALASHAAVWALSKTQLAPLMVTAGGTVAGWGANTLTHMGLRKLGVQDAIAEKTTALLR